MKNSVKVVAGLVLVLVAALVADATGNVIAGVCSIPIGAVGFQFATGISLFDAKGVAMCTALVGLKRKCQKPQMGGSKRLYLVLTEDLSEEFLNYDLAKSAGEFDGAIPLKATKKFVEIEAWYDTTKFGSEMKTGSGFTQDMEFKVLGYDKDIVKLMALLYETPVNAIAQGNDDSLYYLGTKYVPLMFDAKAVIPEKGTSRKEVTFVAKQDGLLVPAFPLSADTTFEVTALV